MKSGRNKSIPRVAHKGKLKGILHITKISYTPMSTAAQEIAPLHARSGRFRHMDEKHIILNVQDAHGI
jgi:hypothetical protein